MAQQKIIKNIYKQEQSASRSGRDTIPQVQEDIQFRQEDPLDYYAKGWDFSTESQENQDAEDSCSGTNN